MTDRARTALQLWRQFAESTQVAWGGSLHSWAAHIRGNGYVDEDRLIQPVVFPAFARDLLGYGPNTLAAEEPGADGKPDFTPADLVTHPFVFETKSSREGSTLAGHDEQVTRYLIGAADRINRVVVTNLVGIRVFERTGNGGIRQVYSIDLRGLLRGDEVITATSAQAERLAEFISEFSHRELTLAEKLDRVRQAPEWNPLIEPTSAEWIRQRLASVVTLLIGDVRNRISRGDLNDPAVASESERHAALDELRALASRLGENAEVVSLEGFVAASEESLLGKALRQYEAHLAYYVATRLLLVRIWEDLGLLGEILRDGGFHEWMYRFENIVGDVVHHSFEQASHRYRSLFTRHPNYAWYSPGEDTYAEAIYQLANTYFGAIESDVLGQVYEQLLERIDRKLLGQYFTPRDIIELIWDLIDLGAAVEEAESENRLPRILDVATGSGGFLVHAAAHIRARMEDAYGRGARIDAQHWINEIAETLTGIDVQHFSAYLAELNLLVQLGRVLTTRPSLRLPPLGIIPADTLALHNPTDTDPPDGLDCVAAGLVTDDADALAHGRRLSTNRDQLQDVVCGNPPYIGQKVAAALIDRTRRAHPYWEEFVGHHMDYFYWFVVLGISKLRPGGRFGFITTEYWLRAVGAKPLRRFLAETCSIERIALLRSFRPFKDAPGQHTIIFSGRRTSDETHVPRIKPRVSVFEASHLESARRADVLRTIRDGRNSYGVNSFTASVSPNDLGESSWSEVILTREHYRRRQSLRERSKTLSMDPEQGVLSSANRMRSGYHEHLTATALAQIGGTESRHGIFLLNDEEFRSLGTLTDTEARAARPFINTQDVLPYAALPQQPPQRLLYLPPPENGSRVTSFPADMPAFSRHLSRFRPLLEAKREQYGEDRPWWSLHRARPQIVGRPSRDGKWADYSVTSNWGEGGRLVVGLPLAGSVPAQGLNALLTSADVPGAYVCGVLNSTAIQELAETIPPGYLRRADFLELGAPFVRDLVETVASAATEAANIVEALTSYARTFPSLLTTLKEDLSLENVPVSAWQPAPGGEARMGTIDSVAWLTVVEERLLGQQRISRVVVGRDLLGWKVTATGPEASRASLSISLGVEDEATAEALAAFLRGASSTGCSLRGIRQLSVLTEPERMTAARAHDLEGVHVLAEKYRAIRASIDDALSPFI